MKLCGDETIFDGGISYERAMACIQNEDEKEIQQMMAVAGKLTRRLQGNRADLCGIVNAKSGLCPESCTFCAQSLKFPSQVRRYPLLEAETIAEKARQAKERGAREFCIVTSGRRLTDKEFKKILEIVAAVKKRVIIQVDVSVGFLNDSQARQLKEAGVTRVNHNVQTSSSFYSQIVTTHSYGDRIATLDAIKKAGLEICCGVILGMGESREDRVKAAFEIKSFDPECVPINLLDPRPETPLAGRAPMKLMEILKTIAVFRLILPKACLKLAGGRQVQLGRFQGLAFEAGINGLIVGEYLTTEGNSVSEDFKILREAGLNY